MAIVTPTMGPIGLLTPPKMAEIIINMIVPNQMESGLIVPSNVDPSRPATPAKVADIMKAKYLMAKTG